MKVIRLTLNNGEVCYLTTREDAKEATRVSMTPHVYYRIPADDTGTALNMQQTDIRGPVKYG
jgi:hypothetical protein